MFQLGHPGSWQQEQRKMPPAKEELDRKSEPSSSQRKLCQCHRRRIKDFRKNPWKSDLSSQGSVTIYCSDQIRSEDHRHKSLLWQWVLSVALVTAWCLLVLSGAQVLEHQIVEWISVAPVLDLQIRAKPVPWVPPPLLSAARLQLSTTAQTLWS